MRIAHPAAKIGDGAASSANLAYAELCVTSNFTFLTGASHPEELVTRAAELGLAATPWPEVLRRSLVAAGAGIG